MGAYAALRKNLHTSKLLSSYANVAACHFLKWNSVFMEARSRLFFCCMAFISITLICLSFVHSFAYADIIIDNGGLGTSFTGVWGISGGSSPYGANSYWSRDGTTYTWSFSSQPAGIYRVHMWWSEWSSRGSSIDVSINHTGGPTSVEINQSVNAGQWNSLGEFPFGTSGSVTITAAYGSTVSTCADAVWFEFISGNTAPTAYIDSITPNPADPGQWVSFSGYGTDDGSITDFFWESDIDGFLSDQDSFSTFSLSEGVHTISFKVKDDEDVWSEPVTEVLTVGSPPVEVIIDNDDPGTSKDGNWGFSSGANPYGINSRAESEAGATYTFQGAITGYQEVSLWWTYWSSRCSAVPVDIYDGAELLDTVEVNHQQQDLAGQWNVLGSYLFSGTARVVIRAQNGCSACADAVRFVADTPPVMVDVPDVVGLSQSDSEAMVTAVGLLVGTVTTASSNTVPEGNVMSQTPTAGKSVPEGSVVDLVVSTGEQSEIVIDNDDPGTSKDGNWGFSSGANPYGINSRAESEAGATYTFQGSVTGYQELSLWWTYWSSRCSAVPVDIYDGAALLDTVEVNQQEQGLAGQWNVIGTYPFSGTARVIIRAQYGCSACADAVKVKSAQENPAIMIDNRDSAVSYTGIWQVSSASNAYEVDSVWSRDGSIFTWTFSPVISGYCKAYLWWTAMSSRSENVPVDIQHKNGTTTVHVNQQQNGGHWNSLGQYYFEAGTTYDVTITSQPYPTTTSADAVKFEYITNDPFVMLTLPHNYYLQPSSNLYVLASAGNLEAFWGVKFVLDMDTADEKVIFDYSKPYEGVFAGLTQAEHTLDAYVINAFGNIVSGPFTYDQKVQIGIGKYYVAIGDSITEGFGDDDPLDDVSLDGRNTGGGYESILNDLLTDVTGIPHTIVNEGVGGTGSADGADSINTIIAKHPLAQRFLIEYGTNDAWPWLPVPSGLGKNAGDSDYPGTFKDNMQQIINAVNTASKEACLAKAPIALGDDTYTAPYADPDQGTRSLLIKEFNLVIEELAGDPFNNIIIVPPDFYGLFNEDVPGGKRYDFEYADNLHPNGEGYPSVADEWSISLVP